MTLFWDAAQKALQDLQSKQSKPLQVLLSGGTQSLLLAQLLLTARVDFKAHIFSFSKRNLYDIEGAIQFCNTHQISYQVHEFDFVDFLNSRYLELARIYPWANLQLLILIDFQETLSISAISAAFLPEISVQRPGVYRATGIRKEVIPEKYQNLLFFQLQEGVRQAWLEHPRLSDWKELQNIVGFEDTRDWRETMIRADWKSFKSPIPWMGYESFRSEIQLIEKIRRADGDFGGILTRDIV